ncbi:hypothetical protein FACS18942_04200 [Planctomycetales bacterium]|nr:hypothetical protein FACS18942_04200 [Planctomycetales bacterium]
MGSDMDSDEAIVIRCVDFSETSRILTLFTKKSGKIEALAKGGRRLKGPFDNALDLLARISVTFLQKKGDVLDLLTEYATQQRYKNECLVLSASACGKQTVLG